MKTGMNGTISQEDARQDLPIETVRISPTEEGFAVNWPETRSY